MTGHDRRLFAIYDLDRTLTRVPTWSLFLLHAARTTTPWRLGLLPLLIVPATLRTMGVLHRDRLKEWMQALLLGREVPAPRLASVAQRFAERFVARHILPGALARIASDRAEGRRIVIATAAHRFYAAPIAALIGVDDLIATEARRGRDNAVRWRIDGANCYGTAKLRMIEAWFGAQGIDRAGTHVRFYSDHRSDEPTFAWSDEPVAVNAHPPLAKLAAERGWRVLDWRGDQGR